MILSFEILVESLYLNALQMFALLLKLYCSMDADRLSMEFTQHFQLMIESWLLCLLSDVNSRVVSLHFAFTEVI